MDLFSKDNDGFCKVLDLAMAPDLLIFMGAGSSIEAGLPNWQELAWRYITLAWRQKEDDEQDNLSHMSSGDIIPQDLQKTLNPRHLAVMADALVGYRRQESISLALYRERNSPAPGPTAKEVAKLYRARFLAGLDTYVVTTNFDPLLELALDMYVRDPLPDRVASAKGLGLDDVLESIDDVASFYESTGPKHEPTVFHLHGSLDFRDDCPHLKPLILTERDYALHGYLAQKALSGLLTDRDCLMVGVGLEDNDVLNSLYTELKGGDEMNVPPPPKGSRYVLAFNEIRRHDDDIQDDPRVNQEAADQIRMLEAGRLQRLDVTPLEDVKNFAQIPQVLHEMGVAVELARDHRGELSSAAYWASGKAYGERLARWKGDFSDKYSPDASDLAEILTFESEQGTVSALIQEELEKIRRLTGTSDEIAIHVWVRNEQLEMFPWCSNEFARRQRMPESLSRKIQHLRFDIALRQAFEGVPSRTLRTAATYSRWAQVMAVPVISRTSTEGKHPYSRLLLGVVTLSTTAPRKESNLSQRFKVKPDLSGDTERILDGLGRQLLVTNVWPTETA